MQVPFHGAGTQEQLGADLPVGHPLPGAHGDLPLLRGQLQVGTRRSPAHCLAGGQQLKTGTLGEPGRPHRTEHLLGAAKLLAGVGPGPGAVLAG